MKAGTLEGRTVLITGSARRIGRSLAQALGREGAKLLLHYHSSKEQMQNLLDELHAAGGQAAAVEADLSVADDVHRVCAAAYTEFDQLDVLINNASVYPDADFLKARSIDEDARQQTLAVNLEAPFRLTQELSPLLSKSPHAKIINLLDAKAGTGHESRPAYAVSKAGLELMTRALGKLLSPQITVCGVSLGMVLSGDAMDETEAAKSCWTGSEPVVEAVIQLIQEQVKGGHIVEVGT